MASSIRIGRLLLAVLAGIGTWGCSDGAGGASTPGEGSMVGTGDRWRPAAGATWQWQLRGPIDVTVDAEVFDLDLFDAPDDVLTELRRQRRYLICYLNAGAHEPWRDDVGRFADDVVGSPMEGWEDERWLDVRRLDAIGPIIEDRLALCAARGFHGVEFDNVDGYANETGFDLTAEDQLAFNRWLAGAAHRHGLAAGLKNALDLVPQLVDDFDFAVNEECVAYDECERLRPFVDQGKAVFHAEYEVPIDEVCQRTSGAGLSSLRKRWELDAWRQACPPPPG